MNFKCVWSTDEEVLIQYKLPREQFNVFLKDASLGEFQLFFSFNIKCELIHLESNS